MKESHMPDDLGFYVILYRGRDALIGDEHLAYTCMAEDLEHAEEQCEAENPGCGIVWHEEWGSSPTMSRELAVARTFRSYYEHLATFHEGED